MAESDRDAKRGGGAAELDALLSAAADAIVTMDEHGIVTRFNPAAERLFGYGAGEVVGGPVTRLMAEPFRSQHEHYVKRYFDSGVPHIIGIGREVEVLTKAGDTVTVWLSVGEAVNGGHRSFVGILRDLSAERAAESERRLLESRLANVGRFGLMGEMAAGIAHEINQPLSAISTYAQAAKRLLSVPNPDVPSLIEACTAVAKQAQRASQVIENLRNFIRKREVELDTLDVNEVIRNVMPLVEADARAAAIEVAVDLAPGLGEIRGDIMQLQQVVLNLTRNAVDAMRQTPSDRRLLRVATRPEGTGGVQIAVSDKGPGVSQRLGEAIFHPFVTTKRDGLGVGLAVSLTIVQSHGGSLSFKNDPAGGTIFVVSLPTGGGGEE
jgi:two-component system sensor kinase FixL